MSASQPKTLNFATKAILRWVLVCMGFIPIIKAARLLPVLIRVGFRIVRQMGSHVHLEHVFDKSKKVTVPMHNKDLPPKTLLSILKQAGITLGDFLKLLGRK